MKPVEELRKDAAALLDEGKVRMVVASENYRGRFRPVFIRNSSEVDRIAFNADWNGNLALYLNHEAVRKMFPVAIVARQGERDSVSLLEKEHQIKAGDVWLIESNAPDDRAARDARLDAEIDRLWKLTAAERMKFWEDHFEKCTRCYACRQSCPNCYCTQCRADKNRPAWVESSAHARGNFSWHFMRAFHQAGRCVECGACESACAAGIPLMLLNRMVSRLVAGTFTDTDPEKTLLSDWSQDDDNSFFL